MHEYNLEYIAHLGPEVPLVDPIEGTRQWPGSDRSVFEIAPHFVAYNIENFPWQTKMEGKYMSSAWYQVQQTIHSGEYNQLIKGGPMDWNYQYLHIYDMLDLGGPTEGFRSITSLMKVWQSRSNKFVPDDFEKGWRMRYVHLWWMFSSDKGDESAMESLNTYDPNLRAKIYNAVINEWVDEVRKHNLDTWPRETGHWTYLDPMDYLPSEDNISIPDKSKIFSGSKQYHADYFYRLIPLLANRGVDPVTLKRLAQWCEDAWPLGDWLDFIPEVNSNASYVSQNVPTTMTSGATVSVSITMTNTGNEIWTKGDYKLGSQYPQDNSSWGFSRVELDEPVAPGDSHTFNFDITAPVSAGTYDFQWRMVHEGVEWFGDSTDNVSVTVQTN